jgi:hypothetical protein
MSDPIGPDDVLKRQGPEGAADDLDVDGHMPSRRGGVALPPRSVVEPEGAADDLDVDGHMPSRKGGVALPPRS